MSKNIYYRDGLTREQAYKKIKKLITPENMEKFKVKADFYYSEDRSINAKGKGFELTIDFLEDMAKIHLNLSFFLSALKGKVMDSISRQVKSFITFKKRL